MKISDIRLKFNITLCNILPLHSEISAHLSLEQFPGNIMHLWEMYQKENGYWRYFSLHMETESKTVKRRDWLRLHWLHSRAFKHRSFLLVLFFFNEEKLFEYKKNKTQPFESDKGKPVKKSTEYNSTAENKARLCVGVQQHCSTEAKQRIWPRIFESYRDLRLFLPEPVFRCLQAGRLHLNRI